MCNESYVQRELPFLKLLNSLPVHGKSKILLKCKGPQIYAISEITDNSSLALNTRKALPYHSRIPKSDKYNRSKCNPTPVTNGADDDLFEEINTGPDPFPFRPPRQDRINQLMAFYQQYLETNYQKGRSFCLEDFLLENGQTVGIERELDESLKRSSDDREVSRQNYLLR